MEEQNGNNGMHTCQIYQRRRKNRMTIILKDMTNKDKGKITRLESCKYCLDAKGRPKLIWPEQMEHTRKMEDGSYMCGVCITKRLLKLTIWVMLIVAAARLRK
jgi:hypothetical protein